MNKVLAEHGIDVEGISGMAQSYYNNDHFKLLEKWKGAVYDKTNPEQQRVYVELGQAYGVTKDWAEALQKQLFKDGKTKTVRKPIDQWQKKFTPYNWARVYPTHDAPDGLAYTVGIDAELGFVVKIDILNTKVDPALRKKYEQIRGPLTSSPIVAIKSAADGLALGFDALVDWSVESIKNFKLTYDEVADQLSLSAGRDQEALLRHFQGHEDFVERQPLWPSATTTLFVRLAKAVHEMGLDWWFTKTTNSQLLFGRKEKGGVKGGPVGKIFLRKEGIRIKCAAFANLDELDQPELTSDFVQRIEAIDKDEVSWPPKLSGRKGYWPDDYDIEEETMRGRSPRNVIYYGPPGTGKTYELQRLLDIDYKQTVSSIPKAEWQSQQILERIGTLTWWEALAAALYDLGGRAKVADLERHAYVRAVATVKGRLNNIKQTLWGTLQHHALEDSTTVKVKLRMAPFVFDKTPDSVWTFAGEWQEECADLIALVDEIRLGPKDDGQEICRYEFVTFHQSYGYEEFVEGLRPVLSDEADDLRYEIKQGVFLRLCERARQDPAHAYAIVIDEINRGNVSKIFGELITLIELDKRAGSKNPAITTLAYSGKPFSVPPNVDIIGAMNTADRSLALVDTALRRRFDFIAKMPDTSDAEGAPLAGLTVRAETGDIDIRKMLAIINQRIEALFDRDHTIGHAYFTGLSEVAEPARLAQLGEIFRQRVLPLLEEYFFEDWQKIRLVLGDNQKPKQARLQFIHELDQQEDMISLFGDQNELDQFSTRKRFEINAGAFALGAAYVGIYEPTSAT